MLDYCHTTDSLRAPRARKFIYFRGKTVGDFANNNASGFHVWCEHRTPIISNDGRSPRTTAATSLERHCDFKRDCSIDILLKCRNFDFNAEKSGCGMQADIGFEKYGDYAFLFLVPVIFHPLHWKTSVWYLWLQLNKTITVKSSIFIVINNRNNNYIYSQGKLFCKN